MTLIWNFPLYLFNCDGYRKSDYIIGKNIKIEPMTYFGFSFNHALKGRSHRSIENASSCTTNRLVYVIIEFDSNNLKIFIQMMNFNWNTSCEYIIFYKIESMSGIMTSFAVLFVYIRLFRIIFIPIHRHIQCIIPKKVDKQNPFEYYRIFWPFPSITPIFPNSIFTVTTKVIVVCATQWVISQWHFHWNMDCWYAAFRETVESEKFIPECAVAFWLFLPSIYSLTVFNLLFDFPIWLT